ncbi:MAG: LamB/YcsF family protein, partial [Anaerolineales bacterium]|nr:LamB/YcsF family protein [Anaerolineales bacterium]
MDLNCDLGEGAGNDEALMPLITSANVACGAHAGDEATMRRTVQLAKQFGVAVGAHPGYADREHFGRRELQLPPAEVQALVLAQIERLAEIAQKENVPLTHVKPHGALYNQAARQPELAHAIAQAVARFNPHLILVGLAGSQFLPMGAQAGLRVAAEGFPDRGYNADGTLLSRVVPGALLTEPEAVAAQAVRLAARATPKIQTLCIHGDGPHAVQFAQAVR